MSLKSLLGLNFLILCLLSENVLFKEQLIKIIH